MSEPSIPIPFAIGETVWWARPDRITERGPCPCCFGKRVLTVILGDGEHVTVDCDTCKRGWAGCDGVWTAHRHGHVPVPFTCRMVRLDGNECSYSESPPGTSCYSSVQSTDLFRDRVECERVCAEKTVESQRQIDESNALSRKRKRRGPPDMMAFYVSERARLREELARIEACLNVKAHEPKPVPA